MIRFLLPTDFPGLAVAEGPLFDAGRVLDAGFRMLRAMHDAVRASDPKARCVATLPELPPWGHFTGSIEMAMRFSMEECLREYEVTDQQCTLEAWPYHAGFSPFGLEALVRREDGFMTTGGGEPSALDVTPQLYVMRSLVNAQGVPNEGLLGLVRGVFKRKRARREETAEAPPVQQALSQEDHAFFERIWSPFLEEGVVLHRKPHLLRAVFPHAAFGRGRGTIRIRVINPVP